MRQMRAAYGKKESVEVCWRFLPESIVRRAHGKPAIHECECRKECRSPGLRTRVPKEKRRRRRRRRRAKERHELPFLRLLPSLASRAPAPFALHTHTHTLAYIHTHDILLLFLPLLLLRLRLYSRATVALQLGARGDGGAATASWQECAHRACVPRAIHGRPGPVLSESQARRTLSSRALQKEGCSPRSVGVVARSDAHTRILVSHSEGRPPRVFRQSFTERPSGLPSERGTQSRRLRA